MPPRGHPKRLDAPGEGTARRWVRQGAGYEDHWAYVRPVRPRLPVVRNASWPRTAIDVFVLAGLEGQGLTPSPEAQRATLIRRLSLDLTGLPPTPAEVAAFEADPVRRPTRSWWIASSPLPSSASAGRAPGSTWHVMPTRTGFSATT